MTAYHPFRVNLSDGQKEKVAKAFETKSPLTIRLKRDETRGNDELLLTANQINRINKALRNGVEIKISRTQIRKVMQKGGNLFSAIISLARALGPTVAKTAGLAALSGAASEGAKKVINKISGKGQTGGFLIPQENLLGLIDKMQLLTKRQKGRLS